MTINNPYKRNCRFCGLPLKDNHGNRWFCEFDSTKDDGDRDCKTTYNNLKAKELRDQTKLFINKSIKNMKILHNLYEIGIRTITGDQLLFQGLDPAFSTVMINNSNVQNFLPTFYTYALINLGNNNFQIHKL